MTYNTPVGQPTDDTKYCSVSDVNNFIRGYDLTDPSTSPSESEVQYFIDTATEKIDRELATSFRPRTVSAFEIDDDVFTNEQKRDKPSEGIAKTDFSRVGEYRSGSNDRWVRYVIGHRHIQNINTLKTHTNRGTEDLLSNEFDDDVYRLKPAKGHIQIRLDGFQRTGPSNRPADNVYEGASITIGYDYGLNFVPDDINLATAKLTVSNLVNSDSYGAMLPNEFDGVDATTYAKRMSDDAMKTIQDYRDRQQY